MVFLLGKCQRLISVENVGWNYGQISMLALIMRPEHVSAENA